MDEQLNDLDSFSIEFDIIKEMSFITPIEQKKKLLALLKLECAVSDNWPAFYHNDCLIEAKKLLLATRHYKKNLLIHQPNFEMN